MANLNISKEAATATAKQIQGICAEMNAAFKKFSTNMDSAADEIKTGGNGWFEELYNNWSAYNTDEVPKTLAIVRSSAAQLEEDVKATEAFEQENG